MALAAVDQRGLFLRADRPAAFQHRVRNRQPLGGFAGLGTSPSSTMRRRARSLRGSGTGTADSSACVYGWPACSYTSSAVAGLDDLAQVHHRDVVADVAHDRQVVRDEQVGEAAARSCRSSSRLTTPAWIDTSSADTGSSSTSRSGSSASARAMPMRWRWPPENSCGNRLACSGFRPTVRQQLLDPLAAAVLPRAVDPHAARR